MQRFPIQTFCPTWDEFQDFRGYIEKIESLGAHKAGICKVIPPPQFKEMMKGTSSYDPSLMDEVVIPKTMRQVAEGKSGVYKVIGWKDVPEMNVKQFMKKTSEAPLKTPRHFDEESLEKKYWEKISSGQSFYGAGVQQSFMDENCQFWNLNSLNSLLLKNKKKIEGVHSPYMYFGSWKSTFSWHTEDQELYSINYLHFGAPKTWYSIPPAYARKFEGVAKTFFPEEHKQCRQFLRHKFTMMQPKILETYGIPVNKVTQSGGEFIITFPDGYHAGFNNGFNCAEAVNFATERWMSFGRKSKPCPCPEFASIMINMKIFTTPSKIEILKQSTLVNQSRSNRRQKLEKNDEENVSKLTTKIRPRALTMVPYNFRRRLNTQLY